MSLAVLAIVYLASLLAMAVVILVVFDRISALISRIRNPPALLAEQKHLFESRVHSPDWTFLESQLQRPVPPALRRVFSPEFLSAPALYFGDIHIALAPIDPAALDENWIVPGVVPFAYSDGDPIYLKPGPTTADSVFITYHDGNDTEQLTSEMEAFAAGLRPATQRWGEADR